MRRRPSRTSSPSSPSTKSLPAMESGWRLPAPASASEFSSTRWNLRVCHGRPRKAFRGFSRTRTVLAIDLAHVSERGIVFLLDAPSPIVKGRL
uniref:Uncharacterized protein n=1 Tax=Mycobacterium sp. CH-1 TaxID=74662 RepID=A2SW65_9MYCO|nr:unknown [Mycobacterium sp. CH-1]